MTNQEIWRIALEQSAIDCNCKPEDFLGTAHVYTLSRPHPELRTAAEDYLNAYDMAHAFETPNLYALKCGFRPAWVEVTARDAEFVRRRNGC